MFDTETEFLVSPEVFLPCTNGDGVRNQGWAKKERAVRERRGRAV